MTAVRPMPSEVRYVQGYELRKAEADGRYLDAVLTTYEDAHDVGPFIEVMARGVFDTTLSRHADSVKLVVNHSDDIAVGTPVEWRKTDTELGVTYKFGSHDEARRAVSMADEGMYGGLSVGFLPSHRPEHNIWTQEDGKPAVRRVQARLLHASLVVTPANADARVIALRSMGVPEDAVLATPRMDEARRVLEALRASKVSL